MNQDTQEKIMTLRQTFASLPKDLQSSELGRMNRVLSNKPPIFAEPLEDDTRLYRFSNTTELFKWLQNIGVDIRSTSNIYKCLRGDRENAYGYKIYYGKE